MYSQKEQQTRLRGLSKSLKELGPSTTIFDIISSYLKAERTLTYVTSIIPNRELIGDMPDLHLLAKRAVVVGIYLGCGGENHLNPYFVRDSIEDYVERVTAEIDRQFKETTGDYVEKNQVAYIEIDAEGKKHVVYKGNLVPFLDAMVKINRSPITIGRRFKTVFEQKFADRINQGKRQDSENMRAAANFFGSIDFRIFSELSLQQFRLALYDTAEMQYKSEVARSDLFRTLALTVFSETQLQALIDLQLKEFNTPEAIFRLRMGAIDGREVGLYMVNDLYLTIARDLSNTI